MEGLAEWDDDMGLGDGEPSSPSSRSKQRSSDTGSSKGSAEKVCMVGDCFEKKVGKSKFCQARRRMIDNVLEQASKQNRKEQVERLLDDPIQLARVCKDFGSGDSGQDFVRMVDFGSIRFGVDLGGRFGVDLGSIFFFGFFTVGFFRGLGLLAVAAAHALETRAGLS